MSITRRPVGAQDASLEDATSRTMLLMWRSRTKLLPWDDLLAVLEQARRDGRVVVWTNGTFDLLHPGHVSSLQAARALGDVLVVGLNSDAPVHGYKGLKRPIFTQELLRSAACRLASLAAAVVVGKVGTATCNLSEQQAAI